MVDQGSWNRLSLEEQNEYQHYSGQFIEAVFASGTADGIDFSQKYKVASEGDFFFLTNGSSAFAGIKSQSRRVFETLLADAAQNYGR